MTMKWTDPDPATGGALTDEQVKAWRVNGFTLVEGLLPADLVERVRTDAESAFPAPGSPESRRVTGFGSGGRLVFPARSG